MRFNDEYYLKAWKENNEYPKIHRKLFELIKERVTGDSFIDVCGCHGLLGQHLLELGSAVMCDADTKTIKMGKDYGLTLKQYEIKITENTYPEFSQILTTNSVNVLVARRCFSEIFAPIPKDHWPTFAQLIKDAGVKEVFLQGRAVSKNHTHPLYSVVQEIEVIDSQYEVQYQEGQHAYLTLK